jgi:DNA uptake protein ComE-like DNA-binding protein
MRGYKSSIRSFFNFSKKELNGIFFLFLLILIVLASPWFYRKLSKQQVYDLEKFKLEAANFKNSEIRVLYSKIKKEAGKAEYFAFDPNSIGEKEWKRLGFSIKQIRVIRNYLSKGGKFYKKEDLKRIYSIPEDQYASVEPYIRITSTYTSNKSVKDEKLSKSASSNDRIPAPLIELNSADSLSLLNVRGIGPAFASRIIRLRDRLGGFYTKEQLKEVYGIDSLKYSQIQDKFSINSGLIKKIYLNVAGFDQFKKHPYLTYKQMNAIIQYRQQHGNFQSIDDLKKVAILNKEIIRKIEPYFEFLPHDQ